MSFDPKYGRARVTFIDDVFRSEIEHLKPRDSLRNHISRDLELDLTEFISDQSPLKSKIFETHPERICIMQVFVRVSHSLVPCNSPLFRE